MTENKHYKEIALVSVRVLIGLLQQGYDYCKRGKQSEWEHLIKSQLSQINLNIQNYISH